MGGEPGKLMLLKFGFYVLAAARRKVECLLRLMFLTSILEVSHKMQILS